MKITDVFMLFGGLALFLYGMKMMSNGLEEAAGNRLKKILEKLTSNRFLAVLVGAGITAVIQSSSATTVMVVGFVNSGLMQLSQAVGVIMGANIGTTVTGLLIALDIGAIAPIIAFCGVVPLVFFKSKKSNYIGLIVAGLGILFIGMELMGSAMEPLRESQFFINMMTNFSNPLLGILAGALFTALIQSSSASIGILQTLAMSGLIGLDSAVYVLFGQNIGTCITAVFASISANRNAKRTTIIHLMFNVIGTALFVTICTILPFTDWVKAFIPNNPSAQIANVHIIFNVVTTLVLFPFGSLMAKLAVKILPEKEDEHSEEMSLQFVNDHSIGSTAIAIEQLRKEEQRMLDIARKNVETSFDTLITLDISRLDDLNKKEEYLDYINNEITKYISKTFSFTMSADDSKIIYSLFDISSNIERIGDHATNMAEYVYMIKEKDLKLSQRAKEELEQMRDVTMRALSELDILPSDDSLKSLGHIELMEKQMDDFKEKFRYNQIMEMKEDASETEISVLYSEMLTDIERILDHALNIAQSVCGRQGEEV